MRADRLSLDDGIAMRSLSYFPGGLELHIGMFIPTLLSQGTPEQQAKWLPMSNRLQVGGRVGGRGAGGLSCCPPQHQLGLKQQQLFANRPCCPCPPAPSHSPPADHRYICSDGAGARHLCARPADGGSL